MGTSAVYGRPRIAQIHSSCAVRAMRSATLLGDEFALERTRWQIDWIHTREVRGAFGGRWKTITETPIGYAGTLSFSDFGSRLERTTLPQTCIDPTCSSSSGESEPLAEEISSDPLGRPLQVETPDGSYSVDYEQRNWAGPSGPTDIDTALVTNPKGDLTEYGLDGQRVVWVGECQNQTDCVAADTTRYDYEATGEIQHVYDALAPNLTDPDHRLGYVYDTLGQVIRIEDPDLEGDTAFVATTYNGAGLVSTTTNARNQIRSFDYDLAGRLVGIQTPNDELDYTVTYRGNQWQRESDSSDRYQRTRGYDGWGRLKQAELKVAENPSIGWAASYLTDYDYDLVGRVVKVHYPEDTQIRYDYVGAWRAR